MYEILFNCLSFFFQFSFLYHFQHLEVQQVKESKLYGSINVLQCFSKLSCKESTFIKHFILYFNNHVTLKYHESYCIQISDSRNIISMSCDCRSLRQLFPDERPFVLTRSTFAGTSQYAIHWLGDNQSQWRQVPWSIISMLEYSLFGFSMVGHY